ncbi:MAG: amidohydrolase family protein [Propionibacterium sp.]|nr:amidohydrolase family protein [Propionibacterium sp.]
MTTHSGAVFDAHVHVIDPRFPLVPNDGYLPEPFTVADYRTAVRPLNVVGGAVVSGSFQGFDTSYLVDALGRLGAGFVGVCTIPPITPDSVIRRLDAVGVRAVRVNLFRGGSANLDAAMMLARRVHDLAGWHTELYLDAADLPDLEAALAGLPQIVIDHLGMRDDASGALLRLVGRGAVVKATGLGRVAHRDPGAVARAVLDANPHGLVFGTDLPSTRARRPYTHADLETILSWLEPDQVDAVTHRNAERLYRIRPVRPAR